MPSPAARPADRWSPLYFLASVGAGGLVATFFMWLYMWVPHPAQPVPLYEDIARAFASGSVPMRAMIVAAALGIAAFAYLNIRLLIWNLGQLSRFRGTEAQARLMSSNAETQMTALPLALAMSINVGFILGMVFVPGLWGVVEWLFPLAMAAFAATGILALRQIGRFLARATTKGGFDWAANNSFAQVLPAFALAMVGVGLSAPAALSANPATAAVSVVLATIFLVLSLTLAAIAVVLGIASMLQHGANAETAPTLLIVVPLATVLGILMLRLDHGLHTHFGVHAEPGESLVLLTRLIAVQLAFGLAGLAVLARQGYAARFLTGADTSVGSYALVCPGVAASVLMQFWINKGLVGAGVIAKFGAAYWVLSGIALAFQIAMIALVLVLNRRHFRPAPAAHAVAAE
ncbi:MAG: hypothetical protein KF887_19310 [Paracoccaceae bacterium]|nr:MAG: hypothetical protein KF887_19310 [Paracoccaceae bacterium]